jgi:hypothetical protein
MFQNWVEIINKIDYNHLFYYYLWHFSPARSMASSFTRFRDHTQRRATLGTTPLDEWSVRRRDLYLTTHNRQTSMTQVGFELTIAAGTGTWSWLRLTNWLGLMNVVVLFESRYSSVGIANGYGLDGPGIESRWRQDLPHPSIPALGPTQPSIQWVKGKVVPLQAWTGLESG